MKRFIFGEFGKSSSASDFGLLILRMAGLSLALAHGVAKLPPSEELVSGVAALGIPNPCSLCMVGRAG
ncbi:MAG: hypothetical protein SGI97_08505 [candidate division Zixibacteria bacterium]|nr:hypothetical protein [candidate division Zixibacteria bacterium]